MPDEAHDPQLDVAVDAPDEAPEGTVRGHVFLSYSHADREREWYPDVMEALAQLDGGDEIALWTDDDIEAGDEWKATIDERLQGAVAAIFLVTPTFLTSRFIGEEEVPEILERHEQDGLMVHALIGRPCAWEDHPVGKFLASRQLVHDPADSLEAMEPAARMACLRDLVKKIRKDCGAFLVRNRKERRTEILRQVQARTRTENLREVTAGDTAIIYKGERHGRTVAVKAVFAQQISQAGQQEIVDELLKCHELQSPVFVRIHDFHFDAGQCIAVADWVPGVSLQRVVTGDVPLEKRTRARKPGPTIRVVLALATALREAHERELRYINVVPRNIFMHGREPRIYPIDFSTWMASASFARGKLSINVDSFGYLAPEYFELRAGADRWDEAGTRARDDRFALLRKAHQYSLGMIALTMLEGRAPVPVRRLADLARLLEFHRNPRAYAIDGEACLGERVWRRTAPGLARIIWRLLEPDPANRWEDMDTVVRQLRAVMGSFDDFPAHVSEAKASYASSIASNDAFYEHFYAALFRRSPEIEQMFASVGDMARHRAVLDGAIERMLNFRKNQEEPTTLAAIAASHRRLPLEPAHFDDFGWAFLEALEVVAGESEPVRDAWEVVLWPALDYMKDNAVADDD